MASRPTIRQGTGRDSHAARTPNRGPPILDRETAPEPGEGIGRTTIVIPEMQISDEYRRRVDALFKTPTADDLAQVAKELKGRRQGDRSPMSRALRDAINASFHQLGIQDSIETLATRSVPFLFSRHLARSFPSGTPRQHTRPRLMMTGMPRGAADAEQAEDFFDPQAADPTLHLLNEPNFEQWRQHLGLAKDQADQGQFVFGIHDYPRFLYKYKAQMQQALRIIHLIATTTDPGQTHEGKALDRAISEYSNNPTHVNQADLQARLTPYDVVGQVTYGIPKLLKQFLAIFPKPTAEHTATQISVAFGLDGDDTSQPLLLRTQLAIQRFEEARSTVEQAKFDHLQSVLSEQQCAFHILHVIWPATTGADHAAIIQAAQDITQQVHDSPSTQILLNKAEQLANQKIGLGDPTSSTGPGKTQAVLVASSNNPPRGEGGGQTQANNKNRIHEVIVKPSEISRLTSTKDGKTVIKEEYQQNISLEKRGRAYTLKWHTNIPHDQMPEEDRQQLLAATNTRPPRSWNRSSDKNKQTSKSFLATDQRGEGTQQSTSEQKGSAASNSETVYAATVLSATHPRPGHKNLNVDSGATVHLTDNRQAMYDLTACDEKITTCDGSIVCVSQKGKLSASVQDQQGNKIKLTLTDVLFVPGSGRTLVSLSRMDKGGAQVTIANNKGVITTSQGTKIPLVCESGLYSIPVDHFHMEQTASDSTAGPERGNACALSATPIRGPMWYHRCSSHAPPEIMKGIFHDVQTGDCPTRRSCPACSMATWTRRPAYSDSRSSRTRTQQPGQVIFADTLISSASSIGGCKAVAVFLDEHSRLVIIYPLNDRSQKSMAEAAASAYKVFEDNGFKSQGRKVLVHDPGSEFTSTSYRNPDRQRILFEQEMYNIGVHGLYERRSTY